MKRKDIRLINLVMFGSCLVLAVSCAREPTISQLASTRYVDDAIHRERKHELSFIGDIGFCMTSNSADVAVLTNISILHPIYLGTSNTFPSVEFPMHVTVEGPLGTFTMIPATITVHGAMPDCYLTVDVPPISNEISIQIYKASPPKYKHHTHTTKKVN